MSEHQEQKKTVKSKIFCENPYDLETFFQSLEIAAHANKELFFMDKFVSYVRLDPLVDTTEISYKILQDLDLINIEI